MTQYRNLSVYGTTFDKITVISSLTHKEKSLFLYELFNELEAALKRSVQNKAELIFDWQIMTKISGETLSITFLPKGKLETVKGQKPIVARFSNKGDFKGVVHE